MSYAKTHEKSDMYIGYNLTTVKR